MKIFAIYCLSIPLVLLGHIETEYAKEISFLRSRITFHQDFPKKGIVFQDISALLRDPEAFKTCIDLIAERYRERNVEGIVGIESRGFIIGAALAYKMGIPFYVVRKPEKLPGPVLTVSYEKEYGTDALSISRNVIDSGQRILIVDDLIATGGSAKAAIDLVQKSGGEVVEFFSLLEIPELKGRQKVDVPTFNLIEVVPQDIGMVEN